MLNWTINPNQYETAIFVKDGKEILINVELVQEEERKLSALMQNIATSELSLMLKTDNEQLYSEGDNINYRGKWRVIKAVGSRVLDINPQIMGYARGMVKRQFILEVI